MIRIPISGGNEMKKTLAIISALAMAFTMTTATVAFEYDGETVDISVGVEGEGFEIDGALLLSLLNTRMHLSPCW